MSDDTEISEKEEIETPDSDKLESSTGESEIRKDIVKALNEQNEKTDKNTETPADPKEPRENKDSPTQEEPKEQQGKQKTESENPQFLNKTEVAKFNSLPPDAKNFVKEVIDRRTIESTKVISQKMQEISTTRKAIEDIFEPIAPYVEHLNKNSGGVKTYINTLVECDKQATNDPIGFIRDFMERRGLSGEDLQTYQSNPLSIETSELREKLLRQEQMLNELVSDRKGQSANVLHSEVQRFATATDASGSPLYPYLEEIGGEMSSLIPVILEQGNNKSYQEVLQQAYQMATRANPQTYSRIQANENAKRMEEVKRKAQSAKNAGSSISGSSFSRGGIATPNQGSIRETLLASAEELGYKF